MNINGISVRFCGDVHLPRCRGKRGMTNSFGSHEGNGWRRGGMREMVLMKRSRVEKGMEMVKQRWDGKLGGASRR